ncbi:MAG: class I SAM-dependent methyltransferase [Pseudomonadota bacterium]
MISEGNTDFVYEINNNYGFSDIIYEKCVLSGFNESSLPGILQLDKRTIAKKLIEQGGESLCRKIDLPWVETKNNDVHDVVHGKTPYGDFFFCDMLSGLYQFPKSARVLDFGCSTGRVIRNLKSAYPDIAAYGCDPRVKSIDFNKSHIPNVTWFINNEVPPILNRESELEFDMVFAISVWSHFGEESAKKWFDEMARLIPAGGKLIFSTHGLRSIFHLHKVKKAMPEPKAEERYQALKAGEFHFMPYGTSSDLNEHWGMSFIPYNWVLNNLAKNWSIEKYSPGLAMANQDVYVLSRNDLS